MKKILLLVLFSAFAFLLFIGFRKNQQALFYYAFTKKKILTEHQNKLIVHFRSASSGPLLQSAIRSMDANQSQQWVDQRTVIINASNENSKQSILSRLTGDTSVISAHPMYVIDQGVEAGLTDEFVVQFKDGVTRQTIDSLNKIYQVSVVSNSLFYLLRTRPGADALAIANKYQETGLATFSHPDFISRPELHQHIPNDTYFNSQFNFWNTGQLTSTGNAGTAGADIRAPFAWQITTGNNAITIAVLDEGVTSNHPDLPNTRQVRLNGSNFGDGNVNDPSPTGNSDHGNSCAGLIAATQDNNEGISGLCPNCNIMPIRIYNANGSGISTSSLAAAIKFAADNGAAVLSNSWGFSSTDPNFYPDIVSAIQYATTNGRGGLGSVVVFSASNSASHTTGNNGAITFPANVNISGVLTVGASDRNDHQADYSPTGIATPGSTNNQFIDVVAPSHLAYPPAVFAPNPGGIAGEGFEIWSLDIPGLTVGYNQWPNTSPENLYNVAGEILPNAGPNFDAYTGRFGGTSAACPQVAGLAGLMLSVNNSLTQQQVYNIITGTADRVGGYTYGPYNTSNELGYGRINTCSGVVSALPITGPAFLCSTATYSVPNLPAGATVTWAAAGGAASFPSSGNPITLTKVSDGVINLVATVSNACTTGSFVLAKMITVGEPIPAVSADPSSNNCYYDISASVPLGATAVQYSTNGSTWANASIQYKPGVGYEALIEAAVQGPVTLTYYTRSVTPCGTGPSSARRTINVPKPRTGCALVATNSFTTSVYPNPSPGLVTVSLPDVSSLSKGTSAKAPEWNQAITIKRISIYSIDGKLLKQFQFSSDNRQATIDLSSLPNGNYLLETGNDFYKKTQQIVIRH